MTKEDPRHVTPMITKMDPIRNILGTMRRKSIEEVAPVKPNPSSSFFR
jgi:hypothetical protein